MDRPSSNKKARSGFRSQTNQAIRVYKRGMDTYDPNGIDSRDLVDLLPNGDRHLNNSVVRNGLDIQEILRSSGSDITDDPKTDKGWNSHWTSCFCERPWADTRRGVMAAAATMRKLEETMDSKPSEPRSVSEALNGPLSKEWSNSMQLELDQLRGVTCKSL